MSFKKLTTAAMPQARQWASRQALVVALSSALLTSAFGGDGKYMADHVSAELKGLASMSLAIAERAKEDGVFKVGLRMNLVDEKHYKELREENPDVLLQSHVRLTSKECAVRLNVQEIKGITQKFQEKMPAWEEETTAEAVLHHELAHCGDDWIGASHEVIADRVAYLAGRVMKWQGEEARVARANLIARWKENPKEAELLAEVFADTYAWAYQAKRWKSQDVTWRQGVNLWDAWRVDNNREGASSTHATGGVVGVLEHLGQDVLSKASGQEIKGIARLEVVRRGIATALSERDAIIFEGKLTEEMQKFKLSKQIESNEITQNNTSPLKSAQIMGETMTFVQKSKGP